MGSSQQSIHPIKDNDSSSSNYYSEQSYINCDQSRKRIVIVTRHLTKPCPRLYTDIFETVTIVCQDPEHQTISSEKEVRAAWTR